MRLLPERHDHGGGGPARGEAETDRRRDRRRDHQYLPLRHLSAHPRRDPCGGERVSAGESAMNQGLPIDRRAFLASVAAVGGSLALGFDIPFGPRPLQAGTGAPEITAWIVIEPDDTVIVRVARSEMGQGSFTALPMLVAEELQCDWRKVSAEFAPPEENLRRNRVWGDMSTGGSRSIRSSHDYLRKAGATARTMLIAAAAAQWDVSAADCTAQDGVITHRPSGRSTTF